MTVGVPWAGVELPVGDEFVTAELAPIGSGSVRRVPQFAQKELGSEIAAPQLWQYSMCWVIRSSATSRSSVDLLGGGAYKPGLPAASHPAMPIPAPNPKAAKEERHALMPGAPGLVRRLGTGPSWTRT